MTIQYLVSQKARALHNTNEKICICHAVWKSRTQTQVAVEILALLTIVQPEPEEDKVRQGRRYTSKGVEEHRGLNMQEVNRETTVGGHSLKVMLYGLHNHGEDY